MRLQDVIEFKESDAENLDLANSSFDAALCRWGLMLAKSGCCDRKNI
jgi:ubiquinone/menaquinone biosynthesis C-methylase UbiE